MKKPVKAMIPVDNQLTQEQADYLYGWYGLDIGTPTTFPSLEALYGIDDDLDGPPVCFVWGKDGVMLVDHIGAL